MALRSNNQPPVICKDRRALLTVQNLNGHVVYFVRFLSTYIFLFIDSKRTNSHCTITMFYDPKTKFMLVLLVWILAFEQAQSSNLPATVHTDLTEYQQGQGRNADINATQDNRFANVDYMTPAEVEVLMEINLLRSDPAGYVRLRLKPLRRYYYGKLFFNPERTPLPIQTIEGVAALDECIRTVENTEPMPPLSPSRGLTLAAREMTQEQGVTTRTGHIGSHGSTMTERIERYGEWRRFIAENISYGFEKPEDIVVFLLIDDGVSDRGHRENLLNGELNRIGVSIGPHRRYKAMCVMDFATGYNTKNP
jgi:hypothetical protein